MGKFTQGPWTYKREIDKRKWGYVRSKLGMGTAVCRVNSTGIGEFTADANAALIAECPAMYELLEKISKGHAYSAEAREILARINAKGE